MIKLRTLFTFTFFILTLHHPHTMGLANFVTGAIPWPWPNHRSLTTRPHTFYIKKISTSTWDTPPNIKGNNLQKKLYTKELRFEKEVHQNLTEQQRYLNELNTENIIEAMEFIGNKLDKTESIRFEIFSCRENPTTNPSLSAEDFSKAIDANAFMYVINFYNKPHSPATCTVLYDATTKTVLAECSNQKDATWKTIASLKGEELRFEDKQN